MHVNKNLFKALYFETSEKSFIITDWSSILFCEKMI